jgi:hypothetical protein
VTAHKPKHRRPGMFSGLRGQYGLLWAGQTVSLIGDSVFLVAFTWQVAVEWKRPALLGVLLGSAPTALRLDGTSFLVAAVWTIGLQQNVPVRLLGRISAVDQFGSFLFLPLSFASGGLLVQSVEPDLVLIAAGIGGLLAAAIGFSVPALCRWRPFPDDFADLPPVTTPTSAPPPTLTTPPLPRTAGAERSESRARP